MLLPTADLPIPPAWPYRLALTTALELAQAAGALLLDIHRSGPRRIGNKSSQVDLVTEADVASQELIVATLHQRFPGDHIIAEEGAVASDWAHEAIWLVDPLDGTTNFAHRFPIFAVSIALWVEGKPMVGVVQDVVRERTYWAAAGCGGWMDLERKLQVSATAELAQSLLSTGFPYSRATNPDNNLAEFSRLMPRVRGARRPGSAALDMAWLADGRFDGYWEAHLAPWDYAAGVLLIQEAGGLVTNYAGQPWRLGQHQMVAANPLLHPILLEHVQTARREAGFNVDGDKE